MENVLRIFPEVLCGNLGCPGKVRGYGAPLKNVGFIPLVVRLQIELCNNLDEYRQMESIMSELTRNAYDYFAEDKIDDLFVDVLIKLRE